MTQYKGIPESVIDEVKQKNEIVSVVEQYVRLEKKSSQNFFGLCPFHSEDTPSFSVSPGKQIYYCFGCHKGGDVIHFIMDIEKVGYYDSIKLLAEKARVEIPTSNDHEYQKKVDLQKMLYSANTEAARHFYNNLVSDKGKSAKEYLKRRGIESVTVKRFGIGYADEEWDSLHKHLRSKGYSDEVIFLTGLFKKPPDNPNRMYDLFRARLMFPIFDYLGRIVAFGGRVLDDSMPKYINSPESMIYTKGRHLYGFHVAKSSKAKNLIVVEGYMDAIAMHQAGVNNAVASLGTALTEQQALLVRKHSENVIIAYDSDAAGQAATLRGLEILTKKGCKVSVLCMPEGKDPDEYIRKNGSERFIALTKEALPLMDYKLLSAFNLSFVDGVFDKISYQDRACTIIASEENKIVREIYAGVVAEKLGISITPVLAEIERRMTNQDNQPGKTFTNTPVYVPSHEIPTTESLNVSSANKEELYLLCLLSCNKRLYSSITPQPDLEFFSPGIMQLVAENVFTLAKENKLNSSLLVEIGNDNVVNQRKLSELFASGCMKIADDIQFDQMLNEAQRLYNKMRENYYINEKQKIIKKLESKNYSEQELLDLKKQFNEIEKLKLSIKQLK